MAKIGGSIPGGIPANARKQLDAIDRMDFPISGKRSGVNKQALKTCAVIGIHQFRRRRLRAAEGWMMIKSGFMSLILVELYFIPLALVGESSTM